MQNDTIEDILVQQNNRRMEQTATVCHRFIVSQRLQQTTVYSQGQL